MSTKNNVVCINIHCVPTFGNKSDATLFHAANQNAVILIISFIKQLFPFFVIEILPVAQMRGDSIKFSGDCNKI